MTDLSSLIARLEKVEGPSHELDRLIASVVLGRSIGVSKWTASLDAAVSLAERVLPGANRTIRKRFRTTNGLISGHVYDAHVSGGDVCEGPNEAIALVLATLRALQQKGSSNG